MKISYATISETGRRPKNEDSFKVTETPEAGRWMGIVCDGMGGHVMGDVASRTVVNVISRYWVKHIEKPDSEEKVAKARISASSSLDDKAINKGFARMGTTMVMASIEEGNKVTIAHIGDSRCYLLRPSHFDNENASEDHVIYQTKDHVRNDNGWEMVARCFFSFKPEAAVPDIVQFELQSGDRIFLCSDGVYKCIDPKILNALLLEDKTPEEVVNEIDLICQKRAYDNYTAILVRID